jgi:phage terminase large subunit-like protein
MEASMDEGELRGWLLAAERQLGEAALARTLAALKPAERLALGEHWPFWAHPGQIPLHDEWRTWVMMAGRGFGKTRAGAEWVSARARALPGARIALVGATIEEVLGIMVNGKSGLIAVARPDEMPRWSPSRGELAWPNGALAFAYSGARPAKLRGPEHHFAWCDELAKWRRPQESWDNLAMGLRLGERPRTVVTTTPRPLAALKAIVGDEGTLVTSGRTADNPHLPEDFLSAMRRLYGGTRLGRQELDGLLLEEAEGALWSRELLERWRMRGDSRCGDSHFSHGGAGRDAAARESDCPFRRIVIGVDPPATAGGDECGIVVCGLGEDGRGYVLADHSAAGLSPKGWAAKVAGAVEMWGADRVVAEANNGGEMVGEVLKGAGAALPVRLVHAARGKCARAEPVAALFESGQARLAGTFPELEDQLCGMIAGGGYEGPGRSPDRADAMVWAMTELMLRGGAAPRVRAL